MYFLVTLSTSGPGMDPTLREAGATSPVSTTALRELQQEHVVGGCWRRLDGAELYLLVEAGDEDEMRRDMARLDAVAGGRTVLSAVPVEPL